MTDAEAHKALEAAQNALPLPVNREGMLAAAQGALDSARYAQYSSWFEANGQTVINKLNGVSNG